MPHTDSLAMTLAEAILIEDHFEHGELDPLLPGTSELLSEARRVRFDAAIPPPKPRPPQEHPRRRIHRAAIACVLGMVGVFAVTYFTFLATPPTTW
ncbi:hypothetical protein B7R21_15735 [Subtercola boreus]|uniref:Uncharacterized protein n=1 Tax=Subtercola boreus TaxID=120213 RepID=A0A3E0VD87_9MICO|nr:hypothetical protein [Subtercola boreus]RFA07625.1 hypothetical protein B7R21_15735 [Subtercola boreus]